MNVQHTAMEAAARSAGFRHGDVGFFPSAHIHLGIAKLARMKPILAALIVAAMLGGATHGGAETARPNRPLFNKPPVILGPTDGRERYSNPLHCVYHERRSPSVHLMRCRGSERCELPATQPLSKLRNNFSSAKIVKIGPLPDGCLRVTIVGKLKLEDAPPWAGTAFSGWRPFTHSP